MLSRIILSNIIGINRIYQHLGRLWLPFFRAILLAKRPGKKGDMIVVLLTDTGDRYLSSVLYAFEDSLL